MDHSVVDQIGAGDGAADPRIAAFRTETDWIAVVEHDLSVSEVYDWAVRPDCGAVVLFSGTIRDHSVDGDETRTGVQFLDYEAYVPEALIRMKALAASARETWADLGRIAIVHRIGKVDVGDSSVVVAVSAPHRPEAFEAARFAIDALKSSVPIWKHETWQGGSDWGLGATRIEDVSPGVGIDGTIRK